MQLYPDNSRYYGFDLFCKQRFGGRAVKIPIHAGFSCPNRDGTIGTGGCIFCPETGGSDFCGDGDIGQQVRMFIDGKSKYTTGNKWHNCDKYIAFFQAFSNTYAAPAILHARYTQALNADSKIVGLAAATRADCIDEAKAEVLSQLNLRTYVWVELGLQTIHEPVRQVLRIGYSMKEFLRGYHILQKYKIPTVLHLIFGLPGETQADMMKTVDFVSALQPAGVKFHQLLILHGTPLSRMYEAGKIIPLTQDAYADLVVDSIARLPRQTVIHRLSSDAAADRIIQPLWSRDKRRTINLIRHKLKARGIVQGSRNNL